jgi:Protein of unknown function (DUF3572)
MLSSTAKSRLSPLSADDAATLGLRALAWIVGDEAQGPRFLTLTGLDAGTLRSRAADPALLAEAIAFLGAHEPSLVACAAALDVQPSRLIEAQGLLL